MYSVYSPYLEQKKLTRAEEDLQKCKKLKLFGAEIEVIWSLWPQLQEDLVRDIMSRLSFADQVRFRAVCRSWHDVDQYEKSPSYSLPWFVNIAEFWNNMIECRLYKPSDPSPVSVDKINLHESGTIPYTLWTADTICKYGWLFFSIERQFENRASFLLFSPLTKEVITLPCIVRSEKTITRSFLKAFSAEPNSPHCVFLVLDNYAYLRRITIRTCSRGDKEWTTREFSLNLYPYTSFSSTPVYFQGVFHFLSTAGDMASYDVATEEWKVERYPVDILRPNFLTCEVFELNGDMVLVQFYDDDKSGRIRKFDWHEKVWSHVNSLGDEALFVSRNSFLVSVVGNEARNNGILPNKIYRLVDSGCIVYYLVNSDLYYYTRYSGIANWDKAKNDCGKLAFWVEPPDHLTNQKQLRKQ